MIHRSSRCTRMGNGMQLGELQHIITLTGEINNTTENKADIKRYSINDGFSGLKRHLLIGLVWKTNKICESRGSRPPKFEL